MAQTKKAKVRNLIIAAMLTALGILIPMIMPAKIIIGYVLASCPPRRSGAYQPGGGSALYGR